MHNDPILAGKDTASDLPASIATSPMIDANIGIETTMPVKESEASALLRDIRMDMDPEAGKPKSLITPLPEWNPYDNIFWTPDDSSLSGSSLTLPGYEPVIRKPEDFILHTPIHESDWKDGIFTRDYPVGSDIDLARFTQRVKKAGARAAFKDPKTNEYIERDRAYNSGSGSHGGSSWKLYDKNNKRTATVNEEGKVLRK